jgi:signal transduction histidine kinase
VESNEELKRQIAELNGQVKYLVKTERRLYQAQTELDRQFKRVHALNQFLLKSSKSAALAQILGLAVGALQGLFALDRTLVLLKRPGAFVFDEILSSRELACTEALHELRRPLILTGIQNGTGAELLSALLPLGVVHSPHVSVTFIPLRRRDGELNGLIILQSLNFERISFHDCIPKENDVAFFNLFKTHVETAIENWVLHTQLESEVRQRTDRLRDTQEQLNHAGKMAAVGTLAAGLAHELNNPIAVIIGYAQTFLKRSSEPELGLALAVIEKQGKRCADLVRALLDFSRKAPAARTLISVDGLCARILELASGRARSGGVNFMVEMGGPQPLPALNVAITSIESVLLNLVVNALDATSAGGMVRLKAESVLKNGVGGVAFAVSDTGTGIEADILPRIFDPFFTTKAVGQGTGLGLSLAHQFVEAHEGKIDVESVPGRGTTFSVWLPATLALEMKETAL